MGRPVKYPHLSHTSGAMWLFLRNVDVGNTSSALRHVAWGALKFRNRGHPSHPRTVENVTGNDGLTNPGNAWTATDLSGQLEYNITYSLNDSVEMPTGYWATLLYCRTCSREFTLYNSGGSRSCPNCGAGENNTDVRRGF